MVTGGAGRCSKVRGQSGRCYGAAGQVTTRPGDAEFAEMRGEHVTAGKPVSSAGFLQGSVRQRHPRVPHERHHVSDVRTIAAVLQGSLEPGTRTRVTGTGHFNRPKNPTPWLCIMLYSMFLSHSSRFDGTLNL